MKIRRSPKLAWILVGLLLFLCLVAMAAKAASFLVLDAPAHSDVILVLAGETKQRPQRALQLLAQGYGRRIVLDVPNNSTIYEFTQVELAQKYVQDLPQGAAVSVCPIDGLSTKDEAKDAEKCLAREGAKSVLIVTSDFHTRRALSIIRHEVPDVCYSIAASHDGAQFGVRWWTHRQWAKTLVDEWLRLIWWKLVDEWQGKNSGLRSVSPKYPGCEQSRILDQPAAIIAGTAKQA